LNRIEFEVHMTTLKATQSRPTKMPACLQLNCALKLQVSRSLTMMIIVITIVVIGKWIYQNYMQFKDSFSQFRSMSNPWFRFRYWFLTLISISARSCSRGQRNVLLPVSSSPAPLRPPSSAPADPRLPLRRHPSMWVDLKNIFKDKI